MSQTNHKVQVCILILTGLGMFLVSLSAPMWRCVGFTSFLVAQPFWMVTSWRNGQWGIFLLSIVYAVSAVNGIWRLL